MNDRDLAMALAAHGYVVAAPTHPRGQGNDVSGVGVWVGRPKQVSRAIDTVLEDADLGPHIQRERIGVVGHSNGGYTALAVAGAKPSPAARFCSFGGAATREATRTVGDLPDVRDPRVRAIVVMAPNTAPFSDAALVRVAVPVRVYGAERDDLTLVRYHADRSGRRCRLRRNTFSSKEPGISRSSRASLGYSGSWPGRPRKTRKASTAMRCTR